MRVNDTYKTLFKRILALGMLVSYVLVFIVRENYHAHHHEEHQEQHCSAEAEEDPCHQKIYHNKQIDVCSHDAHFLPQEEDCDLCVNFLVTSQIVVEPYIWPTAEQQEYYHFSGHYEDAYIDYSKQLQDSRGPPSAYYL